MSVADRMRGSSSMAEQCIDEGLEAQIRASDDQDHPGLLRAYDQLVQATAWLGRATGLYIVLVGFSQKKGYGTKAFAVSPEVLGKAERQHRDVTTRWETLRDSLRTTI